MFEEHKYEELKKLGLELHIPIVESFLDLEVRDKDGNLIQKHTQRGHSWTRNAYNMLFSQMAGVCCPDDTFAAGKLSAKQINATVSYGNFAFGQYHGVSAALNVAGYGYRDIAGGDDHGILIGTGTNAESFEDYALQTQVADGTGAGQISYIESSAYTTTYTAGTKVFKADFARYFNNNSGGSIVVSEVALVGQFHTPSHYLVSIHSLVSRDLLGATVTVADTGQLKATYTIQITFAG